MNIKIVKSNTHVKRSTGTGTPPSVKCDRWSSLLECSVDMLTVCIG